MSAKEMRSRALGSLVKNRCVARVRVVWPRREQIEGQPMDKHDSSLNVMHNWEREMYNLRYLNMVLNAHGS